MPVYLRGVVVAIAVAVAVTGVLTRQVDCTPSSTNHGGNTTVVELGAFDKNNNFSLAEDSSDDVECQDFHKLNFSEQCKFIRETSDCGIEDGFINYLQFSYCDFSEKLIPLALFILFVWLLFLFVCLGVTAEDFFCPSLAAICHSLKLSQNIAGVTFLAFGNGAPDIFSAIAAITNSKDGDAGLAIGALFGAGVFVTTVVAGSVAITRPFDLAQRPFLRDAIFYVGAAFWTFYVLYTGTILTVEAIGFILLYVGYVLVVLLGRQLYQKKIKPRSIRLTAPTSGGSVSGSEFTESGRVPLVTEISSPTYGTISQYVGDGYKPGCTAPVQVSSISGALRDTEQVVYASVMGDAELVLSSQGVPPDVLNHHDDHFTQPLLGGDVTEGSHEADPTYLSGWGEALRVFLLKVSPIDVGEWKDKSLIGKIYEVFKSPIQLLLQLTVPIVDHTQDKNGWNRVFNCFQLFIGPLFCVTAIRNYSYVIVGHFYMWQLMLCVGFTLAALVFLTSRADRPPVYHFLFAYFAFVISVLWIFSIANEIVNLLQMYGVVLQLSNAILGLTFLAWGNSIGDLVADIAVAKQGYPRMAIAACFGGPLFNMLIGIGISCTIAAIENGGIFELKSNNLQYVLAGGLVFSLFFSLFFMLVSRFKANRIYGICLYIVYAVFLTIAILTETNVIKF